MVTGWFLHGGVTHSHQFPHPAWNSRRAMDLAYHLSFRAPELLAGTGSLFASQVSRVPAPGLHRVAASALDALEHGNLASLGAEVIGQQERDS